MRCDAAWEAMRDALSFGRGESRGGRLTEQREGAHCGHGRFPLCCLNYFNLLHVRHFQKQQINYTQIFLTNNDKYQSIDNELKMEQSSSLIFGRIKKRDHRNDWQILVHLQPKASWVLKKPKLKKANNNLGVNICINWNKELLSLGCN